MTDVLAIEMAALTHVGLVRDQNEDSLYVNDLRLAVVCDGMGGHAGGKSSELPHTITETLLDGIDTGLPDEDGNTTRAARCFSANDRILSKAREERDLTDMGTTVVITAFLDDRMVLATSATAAFITFVTITSNNSPTITVSLLSASQLGLDPMSPEAHMLSNILTRALGMDAIAVDLGVESIVPGDVMLLCTDGVTDNVEDLELLDIIAGTPDLPTAALHLIELANARGGHDNATAALVRIQS